MDVVDNMHMRDVERGENREMLFIRHTRRDTLNEMLVGSAFDTTHELSLTHTLLL